MANFKWTQEMKNFVQKLANEGKNDDEITQSVNEKYKLNLLKRQINKMRNYYGIKGTRKRGIPKEIIEFVKNNANDHLNIELTELVNSTFNTNYSIHTIKHIKKYHKIKCNGKEYKDKWLSRPTGALKKDTRGNWVMKVNGKWVMKSRIVYEQNFGKIPDGYNVAFLDGNKDNFDLDNLVLIKPSDKITAKKLGILSNDREIMKTSLMTVRLLDMTRKEMRKNER